MRDRTVNFFIYKHYEESRLNLMKKSELRQMIKEVLKEEMSKMGTLTESPVIDRPSSDRPSSRMPGENRPSIVKAGTYPDVAVTIGEDPAFLDILERNDNYVHSDEVQDYIRREVIKAYPRLSSEKIPVAVYEVSRRLYDRFDPFSDANLPSYEGEINSITKLKQDYFDKHSDTYGDTFDL
jgi:hypothetical protein